MSLVQEKVYHEGETFFSDLGQMIAGARYSIDLETYIFDRDPLGNQILALLSSAASRGVRVRILLDGVGCSRWSGQDVLELRRTGIDVRFFHPLPWQHKNFHFWKNWSVRKLMLGFWKLNRRNHRKSCVIDGTVAFLGGMNVSDRHLDRKERRAWRDTSVRIRNADLFTLIEAFELAWRHHRSTIFPRKQAAFLERPTSIFRINATRELRRTMNVNFVQKLELARQRVWITNPYFVPDLSILRALRAAASRGVDVRLLVPRRNDVLGMRWAIKSFYYVLLNTGVRIYEYLPSVLHAKITVLDEEAIVGSSNLNQRSWVYDLEVDVELRSLVSVTSLAAQFHRDLEQSREIQWSSWRKRFFGHRLLERLALLFRRWM